MYKFFIVLVITVIVMTIFIAVIYLFVFFSIPTSIIFVFSLMFMLIWCNYEDNYED
jgi:hypothetical protein